MARSRIDGNVHVDEPHLDPANYPANIYFFVDDIDALHAELTGRLLTPLSYRS